MARVWASTSMAGVSPVCYFDSPEHEIVVDNGLGEISVGKTCVLPNGIELSMGLICALAGDFYGIPNQPIIDPSETQEKQTSGRQERFLAAYNTLARAPYSDTKKELDQILEVLEEEKKEIAAAVSNGKSSKSAYEKIGNRDVEKWDTIMGGKWINGVPIVPGRMLKLAMNNYDHFLPYAKSAYLIGHDLAVKKAREAGKCKQQKQKMMLFDEARSLEAFAFHFLTDSFSAGHIRTPRLALPKNVKPAVVGHGLSKYMHDEDNNFGLRVTNHRGDKWIAYGDGTLLDKESKDNLKHVQEAVKKSFAQVTEIFEDPSKTVDPSDVTALIPFVDKEEKNDTPMFQLKDGQLVRRADLNNLQDPETTSDWWGTTTLSYLKTFYDPKNPAILKK